MRLRSLRIGLVGAGAIGQVAHLPALSAADGVTIAGLVTRTASSAERNLRRWPIERAYSSVEEMIGLGRLDCLFVLTPRTDHAETVELAIRSGLDVFCEKPLADTSADAARLADQADQADRILMVDLNRRFAPVYQAAHDAFPQGAVQFCVAQKNRAGSEYRATLENAIHMVDLLRWFCGEAVLVEAQSVASDQWQEDGVAALIRFDTGAIGTLIAARSAGEWDERLDAYGALTSARVTAPDSVQITRHGETNLVETRPRALGWVTATQALGFELAVMHFLDCVRNRTSPLTNGHEAARTQELVEELLRKAGLPIVDAPDHAWTSHSQR